MTYRVTKTYPHELGLSACFRQHRAQSHCRFLHGYALAFRFTFEADTLDENGWVIDFGSLKPLKAWLCDTFDHRLLVAEDDPYLPVLRALGGTADMRMDPSQLADVLVVPRVGCESFARMAWQAADGHVLYDRPVSNGARGVRLVEVECREHGANGASYRGER